MIPTPSPRDHGLAASTDGTRIAWYRFGTGDPAILFVPTWNIVDARVVGHQVTHRPDIRTPEVVNPLLLDFL